MFFPYFLIFSIGYPLLFFIFIFCFFFFDDCWGGERFYLSGSLELVYLLFLIFLFIYSREKSFGIFYIVFLCVVFCYFFFLSRSYLCLYFFLELLLIPLLVLLLGYGAQVHKFQASVFLVLLSVGCSLFGLLSFLSVDNFFLGFPMEGRLLYSGIYFFFILPFFIKDVCVFFACMITFGSCGVPYFF